MAISSSNNYAAFSGSKKPQFGSTTQAALAATTHAEKASLVFGDAGVAALGGLGSISLWEGGRALISLIKRSISKSKIQVQTPIKTR